jgi:rhomboid family GlyGly-CTERM serine protease
VSSAGLRPAGPQPSRLRAGGTPANRQAWTPALLALAIVATFVNGSALELQRGSFSLIRLLTCHFTHWSYEQLAWDAFAFLLLGIACERRNRAAFHATLLASAIVIPVAVLLFAPNVTAYRGLSGIDSALFALLLTLERKRGPMVTLCAVAFAAKIAFELTTGSAVFVSDMGAEVVAVPIAHLAGALVAVAIALPRKALLLAPLVFASCVSAHTPAPLARLPRAACSSTDLTGVWTSYRLSQLGPAWEKLVLHPDCRFHVRYQLLWGRIVVEGNYEVRGDTIVVHGNGATESVRTFRRDGDRLLIDEDSYTRASCGSSSSC